MGEKAVERATVEENGNTEIQPQHSQGQGVYGTIDIGIGGKILHIYGDAIERDGDKTIGTLRLFKPADHIASIASL